MSKEINSLKSSAQMRATDHETGHGAESALILANGAVKIHKTTTRAVATKVPHYLLETEGAGKARVGMRVFRRDASRACQYV